MALDVKKIYTANFVWGSFVIGLAVVIFGAYWVSTLQIAHSSFENYYKFRGCKELIERTDTYATCKVQSGETIKLVKVKNKWFLEGDLGW